MLLPMVAARPRLLVAPLLFKAECLQDEQLGDVFSAGSLLCGALRSRQSTLFLKFCVPVPLTWCNQKDAGGAHRIFLRIQPSLQTSGGAGRGGSGSRGTY